MESKGHGLSMKVMRLTKPTLFCTQPVNVESGDFPNDIWQNEMKQDIAAPTDLDLAGTGNLLMLAKTFGQIYLGETFSCYMSVHNEGNQPVANVMIGVELQNESQKITVVQADPNKGQTLEPNQSIDQVVHHEIKELGTHILTCTVFFNSPMTGERHDFRKYFRFQVDKPLDVKTKFYNAESEEVYLEAILQNRTKGVISLEKVALESSPNFLVTPLNSIENGRATAMSVFSPGNIVNPGDSRQYLFCLSPKNNSVGDSTSNNAVTATKNKRADSTIGKLDIVWRSNMGERGHLQTSQLQRTAPQYGDIRVTVDSIPSKVRLEVPFSVACSVWNMSDRPLDLILGLENTDSLLWQGLSGSGIGNLAPHTKNQIRLEAVPTATGLIPLSGLRLVDTLMKRTHEFDDLTSIMCVLEP